MSHSPPATLFSRADHPVPPGTGTFGMVIFLVALTVLFVGSMLLYVLFRFLPQDAPPRGAIDIPWGLWVSTLVILASSVTMHLALQAVRRERQARFRVMLAATLGLAILFMAVQAPSLWALAQEHFPKAEQYAATVAEAREAALRSGVRLAENKPLAPGMLPVEGAVFFLILLHAAHVLGGVLPLGVITARAQTDAYDHEHHGPVQWVTMYWHFLDAVWIVMFAVLLLAS